MTVRELFNKLAAEISAGRGDHQVIVTKWKWGDLYDESVIGLENRSLGYWDDKTPVVVLETT